MPKTWHEDLQVDVIVRYPLEGESYEERQADRTRREAEGRLQETIRLDIPRYETPARGTLWVQFLPDNRASVVVSNLTPAHENFPGDVKGWPVPSDEYRQKLINIKIEDAKQRLERSRKSLFLIKTGNKQKLKELWRIYSDIYSENISSFNNYYDPEFIEFLTERFKERIRADEQTISLLKEARP